jgi:molybdopterin-guanine dinucleotide biosynthesis protein A
VAANGLLLTGGRSRRLGTDKAGLVVDGRTLAVRGATILGRVCDVVIEVGPGRTELPTAREDPTGAGPLAAVAAGAAALTRLGAEGAALVLAVDLPRVTVSLLELLRDWPGARSVVPSVGGRLQPVCARYGPDALRSVPDLVAAGAASMRALVDAVDHDVVDESVWGAVATADVFADVDTPADAARLGIGLATNGTWVG